MNYTDSNPNVNQANRSQLMTPLPSKNKTPGRPTKETIPRKGRGSARVRRTLFPKTKT